MAPKREHDDAELSPPLPQASTKRLKLTSKNALAPSKRVSGHLIQKALAKRITSLPHELQDEILEHLLAASLPSGRAELTIGDHYTTFTFPLALKINRKTRAKYVEQFFRQGQVIVVETVNDNDTAVIDRAADVVKNWLLTVDSPHQRLVTDLHIQAPDGREYIFDIRDYYPDFDPKSNSISIKAHFERRHSRNPGAWVARSSVEMEHFICYRALPNLLGHMLSSSICGPSRRRQLRSRTVLR